jgi:hypothetical protein
VDDISAACNDPAWLTSSKAKLGAMFKIKDLGALSQLMGMHIIRDKSLRTISREKSKCLRDILIKHGMSDCKPPPLPTMDPGFLSGLARMVSSPLTGMAKDAYPMLIGTLQYAAVCTRPNVYTALSFPGSAHAHPKEAHLQVLKKVVRDLHATIDMHMMLGGGADHNLHFTRFADADWANDSNTRKSYSGYLFTLGREHVTYKTKEQTCVAQSTCEAEYYSAANATKEGLHFRQLKLKL